MGMRQGAAATVAVLLLIGCSKAPAPSATPATSEAAPVLIVLDERGTVLSPTPMEGIRSWPRPEGSEIVTDPVEIQIPEEAPFGSLHQLLLALMQAHRVNIALRSSPASARVILPVTRDHCCHSLCFYTGRTAYDEHATPWKGDRLWLQAKPSRGGAVVMEGVQKLESNPLDTVIIGEDEKSRPIKPGDFRWNGTHPPLGTWDRDTIRAFLSQERVSALSPIIIVTLRPEDLVGDALSCLATLQSAAPYRVVANLPLE